MLKNLLKSKIFYFHSLIFVLCLFIGGFTSIKLGQDNNWDLRNYHFYNPFALINNQIEDDFAPAQVQTFLNPVIDIPNYLLFNLLSARKAAFILGAVHGINIFLIYLITFQILRRSNLILRILIASLVGATGFIAAGNLSEVGTVFGDNVTSIFILTSISLFLVFMQSDHVEKHYRRYALLVLFSGLIAGIGLGLKLTALVIVLPLFLCVAFFIILNKQSLRFVLLHGIGIFLGFLLIHGYWSYVLYQNYKSPLFPFYNKIFKSPYYYQVNFGDGRFLPKTFKDFLIYPYYFIKEQTYVSEIPFRDVRFAVLFSLLLISLLAGLVYLIKPKENIKFLYKIHEFFTQNQVFLFIILITFLSYIVWQKQFSIYRYAVVLEFLAPVAIISLLFLLFKTKYLFYISSIIICIVIIMLVKPINWGRQPFDRKFVQVGIRDVNKYENTVILITGYEPMSYYVPFFPDSTKFVRIQSNFINDPILPSLEAKIKEEMYQQVNKKYVMIDTIPGSDKRSNKILKKYNLMLNQATCEGITSNIGPNALLCETANI